MDTRNVFHRDGTGASMDGNSVISIRCHSVDGSHRALYRVLKLTVEVPSGGSASSFDPSISGTETGFGTVEEVWNASSTSVAPGVLNQDWSADSLLVLTDENGYIYIKPGFDSGSDNSANIRVFLEKLRIPGA